MSAVFDAGRAAWPDVIVEAEVFARFVAERDARANPADVYLACACAAGVPAAIAAFERTYLSKVDVFLRGVRATPELVDDVRQALRERLFVDGRIADYTGRGTLGSWLRVAALRVASNVRRAAGTRERIEARTPPPAPVPLDPELALIRRRHAADFERALRDAVAALDERDRNLVRLHFLDGLGVDGLAPVFGVHRATAARWLAAARARLQDSVLALLRARLSLGARDLDSITRLVRSELEISLASLLREPAPPDD